jgi:hypothetical protein
MKTNTITSKRLLGLLLGLTVSIFAFGQDELSYISTNEISSLTSYNSISTLTVYDLTKGETYKVTSLDDPNYIELETRIVVNSESNKIIVENLEDIKDIGKIIVTNESGLMVKVVTITDSEMTVDWSDLSAGKYILRISAKNRILSSYEIVNF